MPPAESSRRASAKHPYSRQSASPSPATVVEVDDASHADDGDMNDATRAKVARKEARIIRNRESAQRSRNQRKAHVAELEERVKAVQVLEERVKELEEENASLRSSSSYSSAGSPSRSVRLSERGVSPALSVASSSMLPYTGGGVNLAAVAPPPRDLDMEVDVKPTLALLGDDTLAKVQGENAALRDRVARLEELVKHLTPLISLSIPPPTTLIPAADPAPVVNTAPEVPAAADAFDIAAFLDQTTTTTPTTTTNTITDGLSTTLSPPYVRPALPLDTDTLARHPAAVATSPSLIGSREALQRARCTLDLGTEVGRKRMEMAARVVIALAKHRGFRARARDSRCRAGQTQRLTFSRSTWARRWRKDGTRG
uniref:BZIP 1 n=1 Tax=Tremella fuciformis TaxID=64657 RepID=D5KY40_9TREE|nr:bZIP 1 [Tremella fuciformis]